MRHESNVLRGIVRCTFVFGILGIIAVPAVAESNNVVLVEEHWELQISEPDVERSAPQTTMVMSPTGNVNDVHFLFTLNHSTVPDYAPGGMQVQLWHGGELVEERTASNGAALDHSNETIHWVQRISLQEGTLTFQVRDGESETWGTFGGDNLSLDASTSLTALNAYRPSVSLSESQVGYAENRVVSLTLTKLVWVTEDGEVHEMNAPIPIDTSLDE
jgi:hypothetical protein